MPIDDQAMLANEEHNFWQTTFWTLFLIATDRPFLSLPILTLTGSKDFIKRAQILRINDLQLSTSPSFQVEWVEKNNIRMARYIIYDIFYYIYRMQNTVYYIQYHNRLKKYGIWYTVYYSNSWWIEWWRNMRSSFQFPNFIPIRI